MNVKNRKFSKSEKKARKQTVDIISNAYKLSDDSEDESCNFSETLMLEGKSQKETTQLPLKKTKKTKFNIKDVNRELIVNNTFIDYETIEHKEYENPLFLEAKNDIFPIQSTNDTQFRSSVEYNRKESESNKKCYIF